MLVLRGNPQDVLPRVWKDWNITRLCFEADTEDYARERDGKITDAAKQAGEAACYDTPPCVPTHDCSLQHVTLFPRDYLFALEVICAHAGIEVVTCVSHTLYDTRDVVAKNGGKAPLTYKGFEKAIAALGPPAAPAEDPPARLPPVDPTARGADSNETNVPSLADIGYPDEASTDIKVSMPHAGPTRQFFGLTFWYSQCAVVSEALPASALSCCTVWQSRSNRHTAVHMCRYFFPR